MNYNDLLNELEETIKLGLGYLRSNFSSSEGYKGRSFYGETFTAATLALRQEDNDWQGELLNRYKIRESKVPENHEEFNNFALLEYIAADGPFSKNCEELIKPFKRIFLRKVSNWVLLRNLVRLRRGGMINFIVAKFQVSLILKFNRLGKYITDNTLRSYHKRKSSVSSQYHGFANLLVYLIGRELNEARYNQMFIDALEPLISEQTEEGEINLHGRGEKQIFGYAVILYSSLVAYKLTGEHRYLTFFKKGLGYLKGFQLSNGKIPLVLLEDQTRAKEFWYSYNNDFDYLPFLLFWLQKGKELLK